MLFGRILLSAPVEILLITKKRRMSRKEGMREGRKRGGEGREEEEREEKEKESY